MSNRSKLLWLGNRLPDALGDLARSFDFEWWLIPEEELDANAPEACALIIPFTSTPQFVAAARRTRIAAWNHGLLIIACCESPQLVPQLATAYSRISSLEKESVQPGCPSALIFDNWIR